MIVNVETNMKWNGEAVKVKMDNVIINSNFEGGLLLQSVVASLCPIDQGRLRNSITVRDSQKYKTYGNAKSEDIVKQPFDKYSAYLGTNVVYAPYVEYGTSAHYPPIEPLKRWAKNVLGDESLAYAIQKAIGKRGTKAQPFMRPAVDLYNGKILEAYINKGRTEFKEYFE